MRDSFTRDADDATRIDHFAELDDVVRRVERFAAGGPGLAVALTGERGIGKTEWHRTLPAGRGEPEVMHAAAV